MLKKLENESASLYLSVASVAVFLQYFGLLHDFPIGCYFWSKLDRISNCHKEKLQNDRHGSTDKMQRDPSRQKNCYKSETEHARISTASSDSQSLGITACLAFHDPPIAPHSYDECPLHCETIVGARHTVGLCTYCEDIHLLGAAQKCQRFLQKKPCITCTFKHEYGSCQRYFENSPDNATDSDSSEQPPRRHSKLPSKAPQAASVKRRRIKSTSQKEGDSFSNSLKQEARGASKRSTTRMIKRAPAGKPDLSASYKITPSCEASASKPSGNLMAGDRSMDTFVNANKLFLEYEIARQTKKRLKNRLRVGVKNLVMPKPPPQTLGDIAIHSKWDPATLPFDFLPISEVSNTHIQYLSGRSLHDQTFKLSDEERRRAEKIQAAIIEERHKNATDVPEPVKGSRHWIPSDEAFKYRGKYDPPTATFTDPADGKEKLKLPVPGSEWPSCLPKPDECDGKDGHLAEDSGAVFYDVKHRRPKDWREIDTKRPKDYLDFDIAEHERISATGGYFRQNQDDAAPRTRKAGIPEILRFKPAHSGMKGVYLMYVETRTRYKRAAGNLGQVYNAYYKETGAAENNPDYDLSDLLAVDIEKTERILATLFNKCKTDEEYHDAFWSWLDQNWEHCAIPYYRGTPMSFIDANQESFYYDQTNEYSSVFQKLLNDSPGIKIFASQINAGPCACFPMHREDCNCVSFNQAFDPLLKFWYFIARKHHPMQRMVERWLYAFEFGQCERFDRHKTMFYDPKWLRAFGVPVYYHLQRGGQLLITQEGCAHLGFAIHGGFATSFNAGYAPWAIYLLPDVVAEEKGKCKCVGYNKNRDLLSYHQLFRDFVLTVDDQYPRQHLNETCQRKKQRYAGSNEPALPRNINLCCTWCRIEFETSDQLRAHRSNDHDKKDKNQHKGIYAKQNHQ